MEAVKKVVDVCCNNDYGIYLKIGKIFPTRSLADHLGSNISSIVYSPGISLAVISAIHLIIVALVFPFYVMSYIVSVPGSWLLSMALVVLLCRFVARCMMFPGALLPVQRNVSKEILRGVAFQANNIGQTVQETATRLHLCAKAGGIPPNQEEFTTDALELLCDQHIPRLIRLLETGSDIDTVCSPAEREIHETITPEDMKPLQSLYDAVLDMNNALHALLAMFYEEDHSIETNVAGNEKFQLLVRVDKATGKRVGRRKSLSVIVSSKDRLDLAKWTVTVANLSLYVRRMAAVMTNGENDSSEGQNASVGYFVEIKNGIRDFFYGCQGLEKLAFPIMRNQLRLMYKLPPAADTAINPTTPSPVRLKVYESAQRTAVERFSLMAQDECKANCLDMSAPIIDGVLVFGRSDAPISKFAVHETKCANQQLPVVLYCPPNAGFYECIGMAPVTSNWVGVYTQMIGLDVCIFNYRGYGDSTGTPDPTAIKSDGLIVARYLLQRFPNRGIIIHGESIGGMVATHVARKLYDEPGDNLRGVICDKSFSSLTAVSRRMLGNWAGTSLSILGRWDTDSVDNYCAINDSTSDTDIHEPCGMMNRKKYTPFKLIMQDPDDEIIHHTSSMKIGVAANHLMGEDGHCFKIHLDHQYVVADALGHPVPSVSEVTGEVYTSSLLSSTDDGVEGTSVQCTDVSQWEKRLLLLLSHPHIPLFVLSEHSVQPSNGISSVDGLTDNIASTTNQHDFISVAFVQHFAACVISLGRRAAVAANLNKKKASGDGSSPEVDMTGFGLHAKALQLDSEDREDTSSGEESDGSDDEGDVEANKTASGAADHAPGCQCGHSHAVPQKGKLALLEQFCSQSLTDSVKLSWEERVWVAISRTEGGSGGLLGSSVKGGADKIKAWILSAVMWGNDMASINKCVDDALPPSRTTLSEAAADLCVLLSEKQQTLNSGYNVDFQSSDMEMHRTGSTSRAETKNQYAARKSNDITKTDFDDTDDTVLFVIRALQALRQKQLIVSAELKREIATDSDSESGVDVHDRTSRFRNIGRLLTVHNGHNGWLGAPALQLFMSYVVDEVLRGSRLTGVGA
mmetsp:Transcript_17124/g.28612  ORF Transcript_17124/g.28612 Transcript_17124/m.28612 type:complete len:1081 (+) Transcript_17124:109-3351(+)